MIPRVALIGANGHGRSHRRTLAKLHGAGVITLAALADLAPVRDEPNAPVPAGAVVLTDYRELLARVAPDVVVICTPPHTHLEIATAAARAGADLLLEKPPLLSLAEHRALTGILAETGRACQVGFQALGSAALADLTRSIGSGELGVVTGIGAVGAWQRPDAYYRRAPWAGRRWLDGHPVLDGALTNPFAHAIMQCLAIAEAAAGPVRPIGLELELERYRARPIEVEDTAVARIRPATGPPIAVAVTLCADQFIAGEIQVHTERGPAVLDYPNDLLRLPGRPDAGVAAGRTGLLENLLAHRATGTPLLAPLSRTDGFTALVEHVMTAPQPSTIDASYQLIHGHGPDREVAVPGISDHLRRAAATLAMPSEFGAPWAASGSRWRATTTAP